MLSRSQRARRGVAELGGFAETQTPKQPLTLGRRVPMSKMNVPKTNIKKEAHAYRLHQAADLLLWFAEQHPGEYHFDPKTNTLGRKTRRTGY